MALLLCFLFLVLLFEGCSKSVSVKCQRQMLLISLSLSLPQGNQMSVGNYHSVILMSFWSRFSCMDSHPIWKGRIELCVLLFMHYVFFLWNVIDSIVYTRVEESFRLLLHSYTNMIGSAICWVRQTKSWKANGTLFCGHRVLTAKLN